MLSFIWYKPNQCSLLQHGVGVYGNVQRPIRKSVFIFRRCAAAVGVCGKSGSHLSRAVCHTGLFSERQTWLNRAVVLVVLYANACNCCHVMRGILFIANLHKHGDKKSFRRSAADLKNKPLCAVVCQHMVKNETSFVILLSWIKEKREALSIPWDYKW